MTSGALARLAVRRASLVRSPSTMCRRRTAGAAEAVDGIAILAGDAWRAVWQLDPDAALYGGDGFHPSYLGSRVAALTNVRRALRRHVRPLPRSVAPGVSASQFEALLAAVYETVEASRSSGAADLRGGGKSP